MNAENYTKLLVFSRNTAKILDNSLDNLRTCMVMEGMEIDHAHIKLFPIYKDIYRNFLSTKKGIDNKAILADDRYFKQIMRKIKR